MSIKESLHGARIAVRDFLKGDVRTRERSPFNPYPPAPRYYPRPEMSANSWQLKIDLFVEDLPAEESVKQLIDKLTQFSRDTKEK